MNHSILWMLVYKGHSQLLSVDCFLRCCGVLTKWSIDKVSVDLALSEELGCLIQFHRPQSMARFSSIQPCKGFRLQITVTMHAAPRRGCMLSFRSVCYDWLRFENGNKQKRKRIDAKKQWWWLLRQVVVYTVLFSSLPTVPVPWCCFFPASAPP